ncbi:nitrate reductase subunit gamma [Desulfuromonas versatilis]|uniref:Nitrate reductase subunit gamma n=1 Tax=Desulfuromonas versatilis TaxID=2802975 RepID=A0ABM8HVF7_9BACT|nr:respiratory nitrate reductase subunit gamma [Desulfuromonas versatilis]BCR04521.1 nitrate reductase subunit gamma [Desulfuromonas versatilis]
MIDLILFGIFPYVAIALAVAVGLYRYLVDRYSWSSQSSQFLESRALFWGSVPWHYAILVILLAHFLAFLFPAGWGALLGRPLRLYLLEVTGMALGLSTLIAVLLLIVRRAANPRVARVTSVVDWLVLASLALQVATGVYIAFTLRWGSVWYLHTAAPWLWSLVKLDPQVQYLAALPLVVKLHAVNAFALIALFPFSRLVHVVSVPLGYLARPYQVVVWNLRRPGTEPK